MWSKLARILLRYRITSLIILALVTFFLGYKAYQTELSYFYARALPADDPAYIEYEEFKKTFGDDGNVLVVGIKDDKIFSLKQFNQWYDVAEKIKSIPGIQDVLSISKLYLIKRNDSLNKFEFSPVITQKPRTQQELDSLKEIVFSLPFYEGLIVNRETHATVMAVTFDTYNLNSKNRIEIVKQIKDITTSFSKSSQIKVYHSGLPYIRTEYMNIVSGEMKLFLLLAILVTAAILWLFFKSFNAVLYSMVVVIIGVIWSLGSMQLFGYKITVLSGLIPPLIIIIGLPNCIFLINKYQEGLVAHGNKMRALIQTVEKVGLSNFLANTTTAIGFGVFYFTNSSVLVEFGILSAINVMATYTVALVFIPIIFSYLPVPSLKHTRHLQGKRINKILQVVDDLVHNHRKKVYIVISVLTILSFYGMSKIKIIGYVVDDLPKRHTIFTDLHFFEQNFKGVLPFEIAIDTKKENGVFSDNAKTLYKIKALQKEIGKHPEFSKPISIVELIKFSYQAYKDGNPKYFILPGSTELKKLTDYTESVKGREDKLTPFIDSTRQQTRISFQMADVGSVKIKELINEIKPTVDSIFNPNEYKVSITGHSVVFLKSNDYLFHHLFVSLLIAIALILLIGIVLFRSVAIIVLSKIPCLIPLFMTAGIMGFFNIPLKPSTILIFSIAFGIASDGTIYILTEYRNQLKKKSKPNFLKAISYTIKETGLSMIYTAVILFSGFAIFSASSFGGTAALGILISITLLVSLFTNLVLLPCILISLEKRLAYKVFMKEPMLSIFDEEEDIDLDKLEIETTNK